MGSNEVKRGRPVKDSEDRKNCNIRLRLSEDEKFMLYEVARKQGVTMSEAMRKAIKLEYDVLKYRD